jgi:hypothetical protein
VRSLGFVLVVCVFCGTINLLFVNREPPKTANTASITARSTQTTGGTAPKETVIRLSFNELTSNPRPYAGKRVTVNERLTLHFETWSQHLAALAGSPVAGNPYNPRCEFFVQLSVFSPNSPVIEGCVPRSKIESLTGAFDGEQVRFVGTVDPDPNHYRTADGSVLAGWVFVRDMLILQPTQNTDEKWPDERKPH